MPWSRCLPTIRRGGSDSIQIIQPAYWHDSSGLADKGLELGCSDLQGEKQGLDAVDSENCDISRATSDSNVETAAEVSVSPPRRAPDPQRRAPSACGTVDVEVPDRNGPVLFLYPHRRTLRPFFRNPLPAYAALLLVLDRLSPARSVPAKGQLSQWSIHR